MDGFLRIGVTGTRNGMTPQQREAFIKYLDGFGYESNWLHHGDCVGVDAEAAKIYANHYLIYSSVHGITCHPPVDEAHRAFASSDPAVAMYTETLPAKTHLARNRDIVAACDVLVAMPTQAEHQPRGGTWYTIDHATKLGKHVRVINPDGTTREVNRG